MSFLMNILAMAPPAGGTGPNQQSPFFLPVWMGLMLVIFYFLLIAPQRRREKERKAMLSNIKTDDRVVFSNGILGIVTNVKEKTYIIKIADNVKIEVSRGAVQQVLGKGELPDDTSEKK